jgi:hypothetical protein
MMRNPKWKKIASDIGGRVLSLTAREIEQKESSDLNVSVIPQLAVFHLEACLNASIEANARFQTSVAICLLRQCVEALTVIDLGLQTPRYRDPLLNDWHDGKTTTGSLRKELEVNVWTRYGSGLWDEPWKDYFANLAKAVHPYAHYSPELMGWQMSIMAFDGRNRFLVATGPQQFEAVKASRLALLQSLIIWTLARLLLANSTSPEVAKLSKQVDLLKTAIGSSKLLFKSKDWSDELMPHVAFYPGKNWRDE